MTAVSLPLAGSRSAARTRRSRLGVLFVTAFVDMVGLTMVLPLLPLTAAATGASHLVIGIVLSAFPLAQLVAAPLWGRGSDRFGRRPAVLAGLLVSSAGYAAYAVAGSVAALFAARLIQGIGAGTIGVVQAYVADSTPADQRTRSLGWLSAVTSLGAVAGPALGSTLVRLGGWVPGAGAAAATALVALFGWQFLQETPRAAGTAPARVAADLKRGAAARLIAIYAIGIGAFYGTIPAAPLLLQQRLGTSMTSVGWYIMYLGAVGVVMRAVLLGPLVDRLGEARLARLGIVLLAAGLVLTGVGVDRTGILAGFTLMAFGTACLFPAVTALLTCAVTAQERGAWLGAQQTAGGVMRVAVPLFAGVAMDVAGVGVPYVVAGIMLLLSLPFARGVGSASRPGN